MSRLFFLILYITLQFIASNGLPAKTGGGVDPNGSPSIVTVGGGTDPDGQSFQSDIGGGTDPNGQPHG